MIILGGIAFSLIALVILAVFTSEYSKESTRKADERKGVRVEVERAMANKDITGLKRLRLMNASQLEEIDKGLTERLDTYIDDLVIDQDDNKKARARQ